MICILTPLFMTLQEPHSVNLFLEWFLGLLLDGRYDEIDEIYKSRALRKTRTVVSACLRDVNFKSLNGTSELMAGI